MAQLPRAGKNGRAWRAELGPLAALVLALCFVDRGLLAGRLPGPRALGVTWPRAAQVARLEATGAADLDPASFLGDALSDRLEAQVAYPPARLARFLLPPHRAVGWLFAFHHLVLMLGAYALARRRAMGRAAAALVAVGFGCGGGAMGLRDDLPALCAWAWGLAGLAWACRASARAGALAAIWVAGAWLLSGAGGGSASGAPVEVWGRAGWALVALLALAGEGAQADGARAAGLALVWAGGGWWSGAPVLASLGLAWWAGRRLDAVLAWDPAGERDLRLRAGPRELMGALAAWLAGCALVGAGAGVFAGLWAASVALVVLGLLHRLRGERIAAPAFAAGLVALAFLDQGVMTAARARTLVAPDTAQAEVDHPVIAPPGPMHFLVHAPGCDATALPPDRSDLNLFRGPWGHLIDGVTTLGPAEAAPAELRRFFGRWPPDPVKDAALLRVAGVGYAATDAPLDARDWVRFARSSCGARSFWIYRLDPPPAAAVLMRAVGPAARMDAAGLAALRARTGGVVLAGAAAVPDVRAGETVTAENGLIYRVNAKAAGWLVMPHRFDRRWTLTCDGRPGSIVDASGLTAAAIGPGSTTLVLAFDDPAARAQRAAGWVLAAAALLAASGLLVAHRREPAL